MSDPIATLKAENQRLRDRINKALEAAAGHVITDNTEVIRALEKRVENLERYNLGLANESCAQQEKIRKLKAKVERMSSKGIEQLRFDNEQLEQQLAALREAAQLAIDDEPDGDLSGKRRLTALLKQEVK